MKIKGSAQYLAKELSMASEFLGNNQSQLFLKNFILKTNGTKLSIKSTNLMIAYEAEIIIDVLTEGECSVSGEKILKILKTFESEEIMIELQNNSLKISSIKNSKEYHKITTLEQQNLQTIPVISTKEYFSLSQESLLTAIKNTYFAPSKDMSKTFMTGILFEKEDQFLNLVATDSKRLGYVHIENVTNLENVDFQTNNQQIIVPPKILEILKKFLSEQGEIKISVDQQRIFFQLNHQNFSCNLINEKYPDYKKIKPESRTYNLNFLKEDMLKAFQKAEINIDTNTNKLYFDISETETLLSTHMEQDESNVPIQTSSDIKESIKIAINIDFIKQPLRESKSVSMTLQFDDNKQTVILKNKDNPNIVHVIMPMRI